MIVAFVYMHILLSRQIGIERKSPLERQSGQGTVEYALVVLGAAAIALLVVAWAARTGRIGDLFDRVIDSVSGKVS